MFYSTPTQGLAGSSSRWMSFLAILLLLLLSLSGVTPVNATLLDPALVDNIKTYLAPLLSEGATITFPDDPSWSGLVARASSPRISPDYVAVVEVATEEDVEHTIRFANEHSLPFLAVSGTHGGASTIDTVRRGIQINMRRMNKIRVNEEGGITATAGGGILQWEATRDLFSQGGKMAVTGLCECVSVIGPLLGGGHSMLQGRHGFAADNLVSARVVLSNGTAVTASSGENPDLFWALRGAGHNFGVVTSFEVNVFDATEELWTMRVFTFTQDKLEKVFATWNELADESEGGVTEAPIVVGVVAWNKQLDASNPVINIELFGQGPRTAIDVYTAAFQAVGPASNPVTVTKIPYGSLYATAGFGRNTPLCRKGANLIAFPNSVDRWDPAVMRAGFVLFSEITSREVFSTSTWLLELYGQKAIRDVPVESTAVPREERDRQILHSPVLWWSSGDVEEDDLLAKEVQEWGVRFMAAVRPRDIEPHAYVNYALGTEPLGQVYGRDEARLERLRLLKEVWDPKNQFGFYNPIR